MALSEGFNGKARVITKRAYGFRTSGALEVALYHALGETCPNQNSPTDSADEAVEECQVRVVQRLFCRDFPFRAVFDRPAVDFNVVDAP